MPQSSTSLSFLDRLDALPPELVHQIFSHVWNFRPTKIGTSLVVVEVFDGAVPKSPPTSTSVISRAGRFGNRLTYNPEHPTRFSLLDLDDLSTVQRHDNVDLRKISIRDLAWPMTQSTWSNIRSNALLAFACQGAPRADYDEAAVLRDVQDSILFVDKPAAQRTITIGIPTTRLLDTGFHFESCREAVRFLDDNLSRASQIHRMSVDYTEHAGYSMFSVLRYMPWNRDAKSAWFIAHTKSADGIRTIPYMVEMRSLVLNTRSYFSKEYEKYLCAHPHIFVCPIPMNVINIEDMDNSTDGELENKINNYLLALGRAPGDGDIGSHLIWPPVHIEWSSTLQEKGFEYITRMGVFNQVAFSYEDEPFEDF